MAAMRVHLQRTAGALLWLGCFLAATGSEAIIRRHDVADEVYRELAASYPRPVHLNAAGDEGPADLMGTLVAPRWILTAAHGVGSLRVGHGVYTPQRLTIARVVPYPGWEGPRGDIALIELTAAASEGDVVPICPAELGRRGQPIVISGMGDYGDGKTGPQGNDRRLRAGENLVTETREGFIAFRFDPPGEALALEAVSGPGDSGGPAFTHTPDGKVCLLGVSSGQDSEGALDGGGEGRYGVVEYYVHAPDFVDWIQQTIGAAAR